MKLERALHPLRHVAVRRRLASTARPRRILVVCNGNMCRSPYLEAALRRDLEDIEVTSAGFVGSGRAAPPIAIALGKQRGVDLSGHRSRLISPPRIGAADLVIVMDPEQARRVAISFGVDPKKIVIAPDLAPRFRTTRSIRDPWKQSMDGFLDSFDHLDSCAATLTDILGTRK